MRALVAAVTGTGAALLAGTAAAGPVTIPPVPSVTVPSAPLPVPVPLPVPKLPPPVVPQPATPTGPSAPAVTAVAGRLAGQTSATQSAGGIGGGSTAPSSSSASSNSPASRVDHFDSSRKWIGTGGSKQRRTTTFTFVLQQPGRVVFTVNQLSPTCVGIGRFSVAGHAGLNRVRFAGVVHGRQLTPGTYRVSIHTASGRIVRRVTLVVVGGSAPSSDELHALRAANVCQGGISPTTTSASGGTTSTPLGLQTLPQPKSAAAGLAPTHAPDIHSGVLGSSVETTARAIQPLLVALLALAIILLAVASLPREAVPGPRAHDTLARHRLELAGLGAGLGAVALAYFLT